MSRYVPRILPALLAVWLLGGCLRPGLPPVTDFRIAGYDTAALKGKVIIIDPGHGGPERGAVAQNGLSEAEVNLGVGLYLWGFLKDAGAQPFLTRTADCSLFKGEPFILRSDLEARAEFGNSRNADLFVSIHHNSDGRDPGLVNDLIIFYKLSDPDCSRDAARELCTALKQHMQSEPASIQPGNYMVLRNTRSAAVLGEASYMNYKKNSEKLAYHRTLAAEAQGYFLGILAYYAHGVPAISFTTAQQAVFTTAQPLLEAKIFAGAPGTALDPGSMKALLDGRNAGRPQVDPAAGRAGFTAPAPLSNGRHELCLQARNTAGNAARKECLSFTVAVPPARLSAKPLFATIPADGQAAAPIEITVSDSLGRPVMDGTPVRLATTAGSFSASEIVTKNGRARAYLTAGNKPQQAHFTAAAGAAADNGTVSFGTPAEALFAAEIKDSCSGKPVNGAALTRGGREIAFSDESGMVYDSGPAGEVQYCINKKGYEPLRISAPLRAGTLFSSAYVLRRVDNGVFFNRTVALDAVDSTPAGLSVLRELQERIDYAGGSAPLTGNAAQAPDGQARVLKAAEAQADVFLAVAGGKKPAAEYYYKSAQGALLAELACGRLNERAAFGRKTCEASPGTAYVLMQTSMPAVLLRIPKKTKASPAETAVILYEALAGYFAK